MIRRFAGLLVLLIALKPLAAQRATGTVGAYTPPRVWPQEQRRFDLLHQTMWLRFDVPHRTLLGEVTTRLAITLAPTDTIRLDAENLTIDKATDARGRALRVSADTSHVTVRLGRRAAVGDTVEFTLAYHGAPERGLYFVPRRNVIWSQGEATETRAWIPTYDASNDKTTWDFFVTADSGQKVLSNGRLVDVKPAPGGRQSVWHWAQETPASTYLYSIVVGPFTVLRDQWRGIPVEYWTYADTVNSAWRAFGETPGMIEIYSQVLGVPYPWAKYDQSLIPDFTYGGMENVSATTQTDLILHGAGDEPQGSGRGLAAHELAHQWFGDLTTAADWADIWLNEGLTTYMESVHTEKSRGWNDAVLEWGGQQAGAMGADLNVERPLVYGIYHGTDPIQLFFSGHVYPKGAQLAHQLRRLLGDSLFWAGMHRFLVDNAHRPVTTADYAIAMEKTCQCDLDWFFDQWAYGIGYPKVAFSRHWDAASKTLHLTVAQTQRVDSTHPLFRFPATIRVITRDSVVRQEITVSKASEVFAISVPSEPLSFRFDEGGWLLGTVSGDQSPAELAQMAMHDLDVRGRDWALSQLAGVKDSTAAAARRFIVLNEQRPELRSTALQQMAGDNNPASHDVAAQALRDPDGSVRAAGLQALFALDTTAAAKAASGIYATDPNNNARHAALSVLAQVRGPDALDLLTNAVAPGQPFQLRLNALPFLARIHDPKALAAIEQLTDASEDRNVRTSALQALLSSGDSARASTVALRLINDPDPLFAMSAVQVAAHTGGSVARARLTQALARESRVHVRLAIQQALSAR
jgi:aminopeptidase N